MKGGEEDTMKAITYYFSLFSESRYSGLRLHETGEDAVKTIKRDSKSLFQFPYIAKDNMKLKKGKVVTIGFPTRRLIARYLTDEEISLYEKYGRDCLFDHKTQELCAPEATKKD